jgi:hypothetical protein
LDQRVGLELKRLRLGDAVEREVDASDAVVGLVERLGLGDASEELEPEQQLRLLEANLQPLADAGALHSLGPNGAGIFVKRSRGSVSIGLVAQRR